jgi:hypothetical protein
MFNVYATLELLGTRKNVGRQRDDGGQNKLLQINACKENLSYIINHMI